ncbi:reverse transcriptase domain-containing protein [Tanacetum coccineum]
MDDEPMWDTDRVVALTPGSAITIYETANEFAIKGNHLTLVKGNQFDGRTKTDPHKHIHEFLGICDMFKYIDTKNEVVCLMMFHLSLTGEAKTWLNELNKETIETWDELRTAFISRFFPLALFDQLLGEIYAWLRMKEMLQNCHGHNLSKAGGIFLYKTPNQAYQFLEDKVLLRLDWAKNQKTKSSLKKTIAFADEGSSNTNTDKIIAQMDAMTIKMDAQYKELQSHAKEPTSNIDDDDIPMSHEEEAKFMQTFPLIQNLETKFDRLADKQSGRPSRSFPSNTQPNPRGSNSKAYQPPQARNEHVNAVFTRSGKSYNPPENPNEEQSKTENPINFDSDDEDDESTPQPKISTERMIFNIDSAMKHSYSNDDTCFSIDVIDEILEEDFDALLDEGSKILHSIKGTILKEEFFSKFDEFMAMTVDENSYSESNTEEPHSRKSPSIQIIKSRHHLKNLLRILNSNLFLIT